MAQGCHCCLALKRELALERETTAYLATRVEQLSETARQEIAFSENVMEDNRKRQAQLGHEARKVEFLLARATAAATNDNVEDNLEDNVEDNVEDFNQFTCVQLRAKLKKLKVKCTTKLKKPDLVRELEKASASAEPGVPFETTTPPRTTKKVRWKMVSSFTATTAY